MTPDVVTVVGIGVAAAFALVVGIARMLQMEEDEAPADRVALLQSFADERGYHFSPGRNLLLQSHLPALHELGMGEGVALNLLSWNDGLFECIAFDLGFRQEPDQEPWIPVSSGDRRAYYRTHTSLESDGEFRILDRSVVAFRLPKTPLPVVQLSARQRTGLDRIPASLHPGFERVWSLHTAENWIAFHRGVVCVRSEKRDSLGSVITATIGMRDSIFAHWRLL